MSSQEAYELAARGLLGPQGKSVPILTGLRCVGFEPPNFTLGKQSVDPAGRLMSADLLCLVFTEVQCLNETQKYLRRVVHEIGLELRSTAVCKAVRRTRDGAFGLQDALLHHHWTGPDVLQAMQRYQSRRKNKPSQAGLHASEKKKQGAGGLSAPR